MSEIVWAKTTEHREHLRDYTHGEVPADTRITVFASKDKVCIVDSTMIVGKNRNSDKSYYRWRTVSSVGFFRNRAGHLQPYHAFRPLRQKVWKSFYPETSFYYLEEQEGLAGEPMEAFRTACKQYLHLKGVYDLYPMAEVIGLPERFSLLPANLRPFMRTTDWAEYATGALGKTRATPEMIKAAQDTEPYILAMAREFRGKVDDNALTKFVQTNQFDEELMEKFKPHTPRFRRLLNLTDAKSRLKLLNKKVDVHTTTNIKYISDRMSPNVYPLRKPIQQLGKVDNWTQLTRLV